MALVRATSHTRLRAHDHYTSSTLIGGKGGAGRFTLRLRDQRSRALHWVPMPTHAHGIWVGMAAILLFMGGILLVFIIGNVTIF